jgi:surfactin family lipopeptide synthetase A
MIKLSPYHEIFCNEWKLNPQSSDYNIVVDNEMHGELDAARLGKALHRLSNDYFLLHSNIKEINGSFYWVAQPDKYSTLDYFEKTLSEEALLTYVKAPFDLTTDALMRVALVKLADAHFRLIVVVHHVIMDGAKIDFIFEEMARYYNDDSCRFHLSTEEQQHQLFALSQKQTLWLQNNEETHQKFWRTYLADLPGVNLQFLKPYKEYQKTKDNSVGEYLFSFDEGVLKALKYAAKKRGTTPYLISLAVFAALLFRHTQQEKAGFHLPIAVSEGADFIYGVNVSPAVMSYQFQNTTSLLDVIEKTKQHYKLIKSDNHYYFPLQRIPSALMHKEVFDVAFTQTNLKNCLFQFHGTFNEKVNTALNIDLPSKLIFAQEIKSNQINYRVMFQKHTIDAELLLNFIHTYQRLLVEMVDDLCEGKEHTPISAYNLLDDAQRHLITQKWNNTESHYPDKTLHQLFEEQAAKTPVAIALTYADNDWTYAQLNAASNQLAHYLRHQIDIQPDVIVGICCKPGYEMIMAMWAVLKSGAAYVPIDPDFPEERIAYLLADTKTEAVLVDQYCVDRFNQVNHHTVHVIDLTARKTELELASRPDKNLAVITQPHHLAYVIYTSGTQGRPKGVLIEHRSVVNYVTYLIKNNKLSTTSVGAKYAAFCFDASVIEIYPILLSGGKLCVIKEDDRFDCEKVNEFFHQHGVTFAFLPTSFAELFFEMKNFSLKNLMVGGSKLNKFVATSYRIENVYGPTETTVQATVFHPHKAYENIPIGKPLDNVQCYVVDTQLNLVPIGSIGELLIGGSGLARKYLNLSELTAQKFIRNPFQSEKEKIENKNTHLYKSNDLVRWLPNGNLEYIGRNDNQVKIRGYRIELGEIEHVLMQYPDIQQATVIALGELSEKQIVAYYVTQIPIDHVDLKKSLLQKLPEYMLPVIYMRLEKMPLTANGKIDKQALPLPDRADKRAYTGPTNPLEQIVCLAYAKILGLEEKPVSIYDDFFELGGDSLAAIRLNFLLERYFRVNVTDIFKLKTPANLVLKLLPAGESLLKKITQIKRLYENKMAFSSQDLQTKDLSQAARQRYQNYLTKIESSNLDTVTRSNIRSVLLTGATGFLGCHLLASLLEETSYDIYLPIRAATDEIAFDRLNQQFKYHFQRSLKNQISRINVFSAQLDRQHLGLEVCKYKALVNQVDSIIHCAALVKYYGHDKEFQQSNVQPTTNLLELSKLTSIKDFHYVSTVGVPMEGYIVDQDYAMLTEEDNLNNLVHSDHPYVQSKYQSEQLVNRYRAQGIKGTIYRVGNLTMNSQTYGTQKNIEENMFFAHLKAMIALKIIPKEITQPEVSPVDYTARAIIKLFDKTSLSNQTYHVFNPKPINLRPILIDFLNLKNQEHSFNKFIEEVISGIQPGKDVSRKSYLFMLYQFWLYETNRNHSTRIRIAQKKTEYILRKLGFQWPELTPEMFSELMAKAASL